MRPLPIAIYPLACLIAAWVAGCATERLAAAAPTGVNLTGEWKFNPNLSDDPDKLPDPDKTPERARRGRHGHGGGRGGGGVMPPMGSSPLAMTTGQGWPGRSEIQGRLLGTELATTTGQGFAACGERVAMDGYPGLARSRDCAAQWANGFQRVALTAPGIEQAAPLPAPSTSGGSATSPTGPTSRGMSINRFLQAPAHVSITQKDGTLTIKTDMPDGTHTADDYIAGTSNTIPYGPDKTADRSVGWRGPVFVITTTVKKGGWREDDLALDEDGRLIMSTQTKGGRLGSVDITRVYDRMR